MPARGIPVAIGALAAVLCAATPRAEIVDRIAAIVGLDAITASQIETELRLGAMLNGTEWLRSGREEDEALQRLVDRTLILQDLELTPFLVAEESETDAAMREYHGRAYLGERSFSEALAHYELTESDFVGFVRESISFEKYVRFRFKTGQSVAESEVEAYFRDEYRPAQQRVGDLPEPLRSVADTIAEILLDRRANILLDERLKQLRAATRIEILPSSQQGSGP